MFLHRLERWIFFQYVFLLSDLFSTFRNKLIFFEFIYVYSHSFILQKYIYYINVFLVLITIIQIKKYILHHSLPDHRSSLCLLTWRWHFASCFLTHSTFRWKAKLAVMYQPKCLHFVRLPWTMTTSSGTWRGLFVRSWFGLCCLQVWNDNVSVRAVASNLCTWCALLKEFTRTSSVFPHFHSPSFFYF